METLIEKDVYTFDELSDEAKDRAREWMRKLVAQDTDYSFIYESFDTAATILGVGWDGADKDLRWSGFWSQGDGASFSGRYDYSPNSPERIREEFPTETTLHEIADTLNALQVGNRLLSGHRINARIGLSGQYCHENTMSVEAWDDETGEELPDLEPENIILEAMRDFARWMYKGLEEEYEYQTSDEAIDESIRANEYEFDEDGDRI